MNKRFPAPLPTRVQLDIDLPPEWPWQVAAFDVLNRATAALWGEDTRALDYLRKRGFSDETIKASRYGYVREKEWMEPQKWGIGQKSCIERGILIPWLIQGELWKLSIRLFDEDREFNIREGYGDSRYRAVKGGSNGLYRADTIRKRQPLFIFEGEFNADLLAQELEKVGMNEVAVVATGSTAKGRTDNFLTLVAKASPTILAFDPDHGGDQAIEYWRKCLPRALPYRTVGGDLNEMYLAGRDVVKWARRGLQLATFTL